MKKIFVLIFVSISVLGFSQETVQDQSVWFAYVGQYKVSKKWGYQLEAQFRMDNDLGRSLQNLYRVGGIYTFDTKKSIAAGFSMIKTYSGVTYDYLNENRVWEQFQYNYNWNKNTISHRLRLEQRFVEKLNSTNSSTEYQNRFRYLNRNLFHLANMKSDKEEFYAVLQNEIFLTLGDNEINSKIIDQNRFAIGLGLNFQKNIRFELAYMNHYITSSNAADLMRHTIMFSLLQNLDLFKE